MEGWDGRTLQVARQVINNAYLMIYFFPFRFQLDTGRKTAIYSIFAVAYAIVLYQCYTTLGDP